MDDLNDRQYKLSRVLMSLVGLWPYEESRFVYVKIVVCVFVLGSSLACQIANCVLSTEFNRNVLLNTLPGVTLSCISIIKWFTCWYNLKNIKKIIDMIRDNWRSLNNRNEQKIILKHADQGMFVNRFFTFKMRMQLFTSTIELFEMEVK